MLHRGASLYYVYPFQAHVLPASGLNLDRRHDLFAAMVAFSSCTDGRQSFMTLMSWSPTLFGRDGRRVLGTDSPYIFFIDGRRVVGTDWWAPVSLALTCID